MDNNDYNNPLSGKLCPHCAKSPCEDYEEEGVTSEMIREEDEAFQKDLEEETN